MGKIRHYKTNKFLYNQLKKDIEAIGEDDLSTQVSEEGIRIYRILKKRKWWFDKTIILVDIYLLGGDMGAKFYSPPTTKLYDVIKKWLIRNWKSPIIMDNTEE